MDETRLDLRAADQERLEQWRNADRLDAAHLALQSGAAMYPVVGRRGGSLYGTPRRPPVEEVAREDRDEETKMPDPGRTERPTYEEALAQAIAHAQIAREYAGSMRIDYLEKSKANAETSRAWSALAGLIRADETREGIGAYAEQLAAMGLTATGRKRDYVRVPSPEAKRLLDEAAEVRAAAQKQDGV